METDDVVLRWSYKCGNCGLAASLTTAQAAAHNAECDRSVLPCCDHCGCPPEDRSGHDDSCAEGCNDPCSCESGLQVHECATGPKVREVRAL